MDAMTPGPVCCTDSCCGPGSYCCGHPDNAVHTHDFDDFFTELAAPSGESYWTLEEVQKKRVHTERVWTIVDSDDGNALVACPGFHVVNVIGYQVTREAWVDGQEDLVYVQFEAESEEDEDDKPDWLR